MAPSNITDYLYDAPHFIQHLSSILLRVAPQLGQAYSIFAPHLAQKSGFGTSLNVARPWAIPLMRIFPYNSE